MAIVLIGLSSKSVTAQTTEFTYQGKLSDGGTPANGAYDIQFKVFDTASVGTGTQQGSTIVNSTVAVTNGIFTVQLDFGTGVFNGAPRFLEIAVRPAGNPNPYIVLAPRQPVTATPYAVRSLNAAVADTLSSSCVGCVTSTQVGSVSGSVVAGTIPVASVPVGSGNYIQNTTSQQASANFNISGIGTASILNAATQLNLGGLRALSATGSFNFFAGLNAGRDNTTGVGNSFFGISAGSFNTTGGGNSFFGTQAGEVNSGTENSFFGYRAGLNNDQSYNAFFGAWAGQANTTGQLNAFFGWNAGFSNTTGNNNAFFGPDAGRNNTEGCCNDFFGLDAGVLNTTGDLNAFFGQGTGQGNTTGNRNAFFGGLAGQSNTTGSNNTIIGSQANVGANNLTFATAIGAGAVVNNNNSVVLGRTNDTVRVPGGLNVTGSAAVNGGMIISGNSIFADNVAFLALGSAGSTSLCRNSSNQIATCSSSLRYKTAVQPFIGGLEVVRRLRPITFKWKDDGKLDVGFAAEEVAKIDPLLTTRNDIGEIEGVKYGQLTAVLVNAVKAQQAQIAAEQRLIKQQQQRLKQQQATLQALKRVVCRKNRHVEVCK